MKPINGKELLEAFVELEKNIERIKTIAAQRSEKTAEETSEFGAGYAYCLGLFLAHEERIHKYREINEKMSKDIMDASAWFNGAADHLFGLVAPPQFNEEDRRKVMLFRDKCVAFRCWVNGEKCTWEDAVDACKQAQHGHLTTLQQIATDLEWQRQLLEWDRINGISATKGDYE